MYKFVCVQIQLTPKYFNRIIGSSSRELNVEIVQGDFQSYYSKNLENYLCFSVILSRYKCTFLLV